MEFRKVENDRWFEQYGFLLASESDTESDDPPPPEFANIEKYVKRTPKSIRTVEMDPYLVRQEKTGTKKKQWHCEFCNYTDDHKTAFQKHLASESHFMNKQNAALAEQLGINPKTFTKLDEKRVTNLEDYEGDWKGWFCRYCSYGSEHKSSFKKHVSGISHQQKKYRFMLLTDLALDEATGQDVDKIEKPEFEYVSDESDAESFEDLTAGAKVVNFDAAPDDPGYDSPIPEETEEGPAWIDKVKRPRKPVIYEEDAAAQSAWEQAGYEGEEEFTETAADIKKERFGDTPPDSPGSSIQGSPDHEFDGLPADPSPEPENYPVFQPPMPPLDQPSRSPYRSRTPPPREEYGQQPVSPGPEPPEGFSFEMGPEGIKATAPGGSVVFPILIGLFLLTWANLS